MNKLLIVGVSLLSFIGASSAMEGDPAVAAARRSVARITSFTSMSAVEGPFVGEANAIRGIPGSDLPRVLRRVRGFLDESGRLTIRVRGLVLANHHSVPAELQGKNDEQEFRAVVSCLTEDAQHHVTTVNVTTEAFRATENGDCDIIARLHLPDPCVAPMVFVVAGSEDKWLTVTGGAQRP